MSILSQGDEEAQPLIGAKAGDEGQEDFKDIADFSSSPGCTYNNSDNGHRSPGGSGGTGALFLHQQLNLMRQEHQEF